MTRIEIRTHLDGRPERAFDVARDIGVHERTMASTGERAIAGRAAGPIGLGEEVTFRARHLGRWWQLTSRIVALEPPVRFVDGQVQGPFRWFRYEHRFDPEGPGTRMTDIWEHELRWGVAGRLVDALVVRHVMRRLLTIRARALAELAHDLGPWPHDRASIDA